MKKTAHCPATLISAIASGQGKTTVTAALARRAVQRGLRVQVFKTGPDFLDPTILERASGRPVLTLDLWMGGLEHCRALLHDAASQSDLVLVEGVMGLYDGTPSSAELANAFGLPVVAVIDGSAMAQTFGALAHGLRTYPGAPLLLGVIANRVDSAGHARLLEQSLAADLPLLGTLPAAAAYALPERHLGLHPAAQIADLDARLDAVAAAVVARPALDALPPAAFDAPTAPIVWPALLRGCRVGVARDDAFCFLYAANLEALRSMGAELRFVSPLADRSLPDVDALYFPGGYPELHADTLAANGTFLDAVRTHHRAGKPIVAECGGWMFLASTLIDLDGRAHAMAGLLPGTATLHRGVQAIAPQALDTPHGELRGHTFHHSRMSDTPNPWATARNPLGGPGEAIFRDGRLFASYVHWYFPSHPEAAAALFRP